MVPVRAGIKPNVITFTTLISCCQRAGRWKRAMQFFTEMEEAGVRPDLKAYNSIISACSRGARWEDAWDICSTMRRSGMPPNTRTYNALISACERAREPERALEAYHRMTRESGAHLTYPQQHSPINVLKCQVAVVDMSHHLVPRYVQQAVARLKFFVTNNSDVSSSLALCCLIEVERTLF